MIESRLVDDRELRVRNSAARLREGLQQRLVAAVRSELRDRGEQELVAEPEVATRGRAVDLAGCVELALRYRVVHHLEAIRGHAAHVAQVVAAERGSRECFTRRLGKQPVRDPQVEGIGEVHLCIEVMNHGRHAVRNADQAAESGRRIAKQVHDVDFVLSA